MTFTALASKDSNNKGIGSRLSMYHSYLNPADALSQFTFSELGLR